MIIADQFTLDFENPDAALELALRDQYARNEAAQAAYWGPDRYVIAWVCQGSYDREWWDGLREYERHIWRQRYEFERARAQACGCTMNTPGYVVAMAQDAFKHAKQLAESWAVDLRKAFLAGQPCPIKPVPGPLGTESILRWAFELSSVNPASLPEAQIK